MSAEPPHRSVALVTGGSGELGQAICRALAPAYAVAVHFHRNADAATGVVDAIAAAGGFARAFAADLTDARAAEALVAAVTDELGPIDVLVNNAGTIRDGLLFTLSEEDVDTVLELHLAAAFRLTRAAAALMMRRRRGAIINISSRAASSPGRGQSNYAAAKAGLEGFTRAMAVELGAKGIRVNAVAPGVIVSEMTRAIRDAAENELLDRIALRRFGSAADVAGAVAFLASPAAEYITGEVLHVDGGLR